MTNKEIRDKEINNNPTVAVCIKSTSVDKAIDAIQNLTRKSERERVIGEIEKWVIDNKDNVAIAGEYYNIIYLEDDTSSKGLKSKLNSLK